MAIEVFNRYENKFQMNKELYMDFKRELLKRMEMDEFNQNDEFYKIANLYYDTKDDLLIRRSLDKPKYKEKVRLRSYGVPEENDKVYLEVKKKFKGIVNKRRTTLKLDEAYEFLDTGIKPEYKEYMNKQVLKELSYILKLYDLEPKVYIAYDRIAYFEKENREFRVTFDTNIRTRRYDLKLEYGDYGNNLVEDDLWLMEVKAENTVPLWFSKLLSEYKLYSSSFSKYGNEYKNMIKNSMDAKGELNICLNQYSAQQPQQLIPQYL
ncbi:polyphosphate polymerase domain-containing protein [Clostridium intestinale]|uniref:polyphosphate polymerase domain-containing protein n=1 Tax=Clostridium intestinale TaxID=36845 RepID=UPI0028EC009D|nr:polyphosphate polymerase domain-containing protein [Clostridium intestinale]